MIAQASPILEPFVSVTQEGKLRYNLHKGQAEALAAQERIIAIISGTQGGKTSFGPLWLYQEIKRKGPGDYLVVTPTFPLLGIKLLPEFLRFFKRYLGLGEYTGSPIKVFKFSEQGQLKTFGESGPEFDTNIYFGYASDPESLESATARGAWLDEAGQKKFKRGSWDAIIRRLALARGRVLITTTPYNLGWLKTEIWDKRKTRANPGSNIRVVRFESIQNPAFPREEYEEARANLPRWKFDLFYRAIFTRPAGLIYDNFDEGLCKIPRFNIPGDWPRFLGLDFGGVHLAGLFFALDPQTVARDERGNILDYSTGKYYAYREYFAGGKTVAQHTRELLKGEPGLPFAVGGSLSEDNWRVEFKSAGLPVRAPDIKEVEVGIDRVYSMHQKNSLFIFADLVNYLDEKASYSRALDDNEQPTEEIENKSDYHLSDCERYIMGWINRKGKKLQSARVDLRAQAPQIAGQPGPSKSPQEIAEELERYEQEQNGI